MSRESDSAVGSAGKYGAEFAEVYDSIFPPMTLVPGSSEWLAAQLPEADAPHLLELGVGTGRVLLPLTQLLVGQGRHPVSMGIDASPEMIEILRKTDESGLIDSAIADIAVLRPEEKYDLILCVCATISIITDPLAQRAVFANAAGALAPHGRLVVETHHDVAIRSMFGPLNTVKYMIPYPEPGTALATFGTLEAEIWTVQHVWITPTEIKRLSEVSRLTSNAELDGYAETAGLHLISRHSDLAGHTFDEQSVISVSVYAHEGDVQ